jgi:hypothetical protein
LLATSSTPQPPPPWWGGSRPLRSAHAQPGSSALPAAAVPSPALLPSNSPDCSPPVAAAALLLPRHNSSPLPSKASPGLPSATARHVRVSFLRACFSDPLLLRAPRLNAAYPALLFLSRLLSH